MAGIGKVASEYEEFQEPAVLYALYRQRDRFSSFRSKRE